MSAETDWLGIIYSFVGRDFSHLGPRQALDAHRQAIEADHAAEIERKDAAITELVATLKDAAEMVDEWGCYASDYFKEKWNLVGDISRLREVIAKYDITKG